MAQTNRQTEIVFSFGTTGNISSCLNKIRGRIEDITQRLQAGITGIKMPHNYITKFVDFTDDVTMLLDLLQNAKSTSDIDSDECSELVLYEVEINLSWKPGSQTAALKICDCNLHEPVFTDDKLKFDWNREVVELGTIGVRVYSYQCHSKDISKVYSENTQCCKSNDQPLTLTKFNNFFDSLLAVFFKVKGVALLLNYEKEVRCPSLDEKDVHEQFGSLRDKGDVASDAPSESSIKSAKKLGNRGKIPKAAKLEKPILKGVGKSSVGTKKLKAIPAHKKYLEKYLPKLRRENISENHFLLREMNWSKWQLAVHPKQKVVMDTATQFASDVSCQRRCCKGYRAKTIFGGKTKVPAIYEIGVQTKTHPRKYVTYSKMCRGFTSSSNWENKLFGQKDIRKQIDSLITKDCSVYVRRLVLKGDKSKMKVRQALKRYDYAWKGLRSVRDGHRSVLKGDVEISSEMDI